MFILLHVVALLYMRPKSGHGLLVLKPSIAQIKQWAFKNFIHQLCAHRIKLETILIALESEAQRVIQTY